MPKAKKPKAKLVSKKIKRNPTSLKLRGTKLSVSKKPIKKEKILDKKKIKPKKVLKKSPTSLKLRGMKSKASKKPVIVKKQKAKRNPTSPRLRGISDRSAPLKKSARRAKIKPAVTEFPAEALFKARIKVIGIGGGGGSIVSEIGRSLEKAHFVVADTDIRALKKKSGIKYFWFGEEQTHGLGTGVNVDLARQAAEGAREKISANFKDQDIVIFIASLGGGLGSGATQVFAEAAREFGGITFGIFTMPFKFEGKNKLRIAQNALKSLRKVFKCFFGNSK